MRSLVAASLLLAVPALAQEGPVATDKGGDESAAAEVYDDSKAPTEQDALALFAGRIGRIGPLRVPGAARRPAATRPIAC